MWTYKYGKFDDNQVLNAKNDMRKRIFFLLLCVDPKTKDNYTNININDAFEGTLTEFGGLCELLDNPPQFVHIMSLLEAALLEYNSENFNFRVYRKLVLDAGNEVLKIEEV